MVLIPMICPICHGVIETFDETVKQGQCPYCRTIIRDVPTRQEGYLRLIDPVSVLGIESNDQLFSRITQFTQFGEIQRAKELLDEYTDRYPQDFRGWDALFSIDGSSNNVAAYIYRMINTARSTKDRSRLHIIYIKVCGQIQDIESQLPKLKKELALLDQARLTQTDLRANGCFYAPFMFLAVFFLLAGLLQLYFLKPDGDLVFALIILSSGIVFFLIATLVRSKYKRAFRRAETPLNPDATEVKPKRRYAAEYQQLQTKIETLESRLNKLRAGRAALEQAVTS